MVRLVTVHCPKIYGEQVFEAVKELSSKFVFQVVRDISEDSVQISFKLRDKHLQYVLEKINDTGCGKLFGHIDVMMLLLSRPPISTLGQQLDKDGSKKKKREYRISERMTVDEINSMIDEGNHLTFNYMMLLLIASTMAATGLLTDSSTTIIAAVLLSPLMGPILSITFGIAVNDVATIKKGVRNELVGIGISLTVGLCAGALGSFLYSPSDRSDEIVSRGEAFNLIGGFVVAVCSGVAVVLGVTTGGASALIGTSISAALLAPLVNAGICIAMACKYHFQNGAEHDSREYAIWGATSFALFGINLITIVIVGFLTFRYLKDIRPEHQRPFTQSIDGTPMVPNNSFTTERTSVVQMNALHDYYRPSQYDNSKV